MSIARPNISIYITSNRLSTCVSVFTIKWSNVTYCLFTRYPVEG